MTVSVKLLVLSFIIALIKPVMAGNVYSTVKAVFRDAKIEVDDGQHEVAYEPAAVRSQDRR